jgi:Ca2+-binding EF-hand superfamily protein
VNELEYIRFMLVAMKKVDAKLFDDLHHQFLRMDATGDGKITKNDLKIMAARKMRKVNLLSHHIDCLIHS